MMIVMMMSLFILFSWEYLVMNICYFKRFCKRKTDYCWLRRWLRLTKKQERLSSTRNMKVITSGMFVMQVFAVIRRYPLIRKKFYSFLVIIQRILRRKKKLYSIKRILIGQTFLIKINCGLLLSLGVEKSQKLPKFRSYRGSLGAERKLQKWYVQILHIALSKFKPTTIAFNGALRGAPAKESEGKAFPHHYKTNSQILRLRYVSLKMTRFKLHFLTTNY